MIEDRVIYHGADGDEILGILRSRMMRPNSEGKMFFSERRYDSVFMHGGDLKRRLTFAIKVRLRIPSDASIERWETPGVSDTLVLRTTVPIMAEVLTLYIRRPRDMKVEMVHGAENIRRLLDQTA